MTDTKTFTAADLAHCTCSDYYTQMPMLRGAVYSSGVHALIEGTSSFWLVDLIASHMAYGKKICRRLPVGEMAVIRLVANKTGSSAKVRISYTDRSTGKQLPEQTVQTIPYTDFPFDGFGGEVTLWLYNDGSRYTLYLPSEH